MFQGGVSDAGKITGKGPEGEQQEREAWGHQEAIRETGPAVGLDR
jgi:hypothetical protein